MKVVKQRIDVLWSTPEPEKAIEKAGRTCYKSEDKITNTSASAFCRMLRKSGHHAMLEHASVSVKIRTDRGVTHALVRHRLASFAQESTQYCNYSKAKFGHQITVIKPAILANKLSTDSAPLAWSIACKAAEDYYFKLLAQGESPQIARSVLPTCVKTELVMTANLREWRHVIQLRGASADQHQFNTIAHGLWKIMYSIAPSVFEDIQPTTSDIDPVIMGGLNV